MPHAVPGIEPGWLNLEARNLPLDQNAPQKQAKGGWYNPLCCFTLIELELCEKNAYQLLRDSVIAWYTNSWS